MLLRVEQGPMQCTNHRSRRNRGTSKLVKFAAVFFYAPPALVVALEIGAAKIRYPIGFSDINLVSEPRGFFMCDHSGTPNSKVRVDRNHDFDISAVTIRSHNAKDDRRDLAPELSLENSTLLTEPHLVC